MGPGSAVHRKRTLHRVQDTRHIARHALRMTDLHGSHDEECVPRMLRSAISAFTRVFDARCLWRRGALLIRAHHALRWVPAPRSSVKDAAPRPGHGGRYLANRATSSTCGVWRNWSTG